MIRETAEAIVEELACQFSGLQVESYPDDPITFVPRGQRGALVVSFGGRRWSEPEEDKPRHIVEIVYDLALLQVNYRKKQGQEGIEELLDEVATHMEKFEANGFVFYPMRDDYIDYDPARSLFIYGMKLRGIQKPRLEV